VSALVLPSTSDLARGFPGARARPTRHRGRLRGQEPAMPSDYDDELQSTGATHDIDAGRRFT
jgi:hypothetical protein